MTVHDSAVAGTTGLVPVDPVTESQKRSRAMDGRHGACPRGATIVYITVHDSAVAGTTGLVPVDR